MLYEREVAVAAEAAGKSISIQSVTSVTLMFLLLMAWNCCGTASAATLGVEWGRVTDSRVHHYDVYYGKTSRLYSDKLVSSATSIAIPDLDAGSTYFIAVRACDEAGTTCSDLSDEINMVVREATPAERFDPVTVDLSADVVSGFAPLTVTFTDRSTGSVSSRLWSFGDGGSSTASLPVYTYTAPGVYSVSLTVTSASGTQTATKPALITVGSRTAAPTPPDSDESTGDESSAADDVVTAMHLETGAIRIDTAWQWVPFRAPFVDPIVVVKGLSANGWEPSVVRVRDIGPAGFWVRVQEWNYLDGRHVPEQSSYLAMERGTYSLPDGTRVEAGSLDTKGTFAFQYQAFSDSFFDVPVVFAAVTSTAGANAVTARLNRVTTAGFYVGLREQERNRRQHGSERVDYIAWEPSAGMISGVRYEVGRTGSVVNNRANTLAFESLFDEPPLLVADMQTTNDWDPASLRWDVLSADAVDLWVQEEQSKDRELKHAEEDVGYFISDVED